MDILSRLAASAVGVAASVKPVVAPLFLPAPRAALDIGDAATGLDEHEHADAPAIDAPAATRHPGAPEPLVPAAVERHIRSSRALQAQAQPDRQPVPAAPTEAAWREAMPIGPRQPLAEPAIVPRRDGIPARQFEPTPFNLSGAAENRLPADPPSTRELSTHAPVGTVPLSSRQVSMPAPPVPADVHPDAAAAMFNRLRSLRDSRATPMSRRDPVVRVTIGRIEVRSAPAVAPEPVPAPVRTSKAPTPPRITLAEYLSRTREAR
jgi:hypothetical protein